MRNIWWRLRAAVVLVSTLSAGGLMAAAMATPATAQAALATIVERPFTADSGDSCGYTRGMFGWHLGEPTVDVTGTLIDRPTSDTPLPTCPDDRRFSTATFTAYARNVVVDTDVVRVDNGSRKYGLRLANSVSTAPIDRVIVQVCRSPLLSSPPTYCGPRREYRAPVS